MYNVRTNHSIFTSNPFKNKAMILAMVVGIGMLLAISLIPVLAGVFHLAQLTLTQWVVTIALSLAIIPVVEVGKAIQAIKDKKKRVEIDE